MKILVKVLYIVIALTPVMCGSGSSQVRDFDLVNKNTVVTQDTIAIVPGTLREQDLVIAAALSKELAERSKFQVKPFQEVEKLLPDYHHIVQDWGAAPAGDKKKNVYWLSPQNKNRVNSLYRKLNIRYIFLVWTDDLKAQVSVARNTQGGQSSSVKYYIKAYGRLIDYPSSKIVGYSINVYTGGDSFCFILNIPNWFRTEGGVINSMLEDSASIIAREMVRVVQGK